jgi:hypothetical protein
LIFESELEERWLAHALLWAPRKPKLLPRLQPLIGR